ncbi:MAG TPA: hypothetical protein VHT91_38415 [Kofleriaceae bacterium]|jgi:hypothetical protein|nr:hypothetical protein [Kofleriaceae bacterium]
MIPYDELVAALAAWRTRQGLPVAQQATAAPPVSSSSSSSASRGRGAPAAPAPAARPVAARVAAAPPAASSDFDDAALVEDASYDSGEDYVMQLGGETAESTAIGSAPEPPPTRGKRW